MVNDWTWCLISRSTVVLYSSWKLVQSLPPESTSVPELLAFDEPYGLTGPGFLCCLTHSAPRMCCPALCPARLSSFLPPTWPSFLSGKILFRFWFICPLAFSGFSQKQVFMVVYLSRQQCLCSASSSMYVHTCVGWLLSLAPGRYLEGVCWLCHRTQEQRQSVRGTEWLPTGSCVGVLDLISVLLHLLKYW